MNAFINFLNDSNKVARFLLGYWLITPIFFGLYILLTAQTTGMQLRELLNIPTIAIAFLVACMTVILAAMLRLARRENPNTVRIFSIYAVVQQLLVVNLIGAVGSYFLTRALWNEPREPFAPVHRWILGAGMTILGMLSGLVLLIALNFFHLLG